MPELPKLLAPFLVLPAHVELWHIAAGNPKSPKQVAPGKGSTSALCAREMFTRKRVPLHACSLRETVSQSCVSASFLSSVCSFSATLARSSAIFLSSSEPSTFLRAFLAVRPTAPRKCISLIDRRENAVLTDGLPNSPRYHTLCQEGQIRSHSYTQFMRLALNLQIFRPAHVGRTFPEQPWQAFRDIPGVSK